MLGRHHDFELGDETDLFFFDSLAIPPSKYRPISQFKDQKFENPQTAQLSKLLQQNIILQDILNEINGDVNGVVSDIVSVAVNTTATTTKLDNNST